MLAPLRRRNFALLWSGGLLSLMGDWVLLIGLMTEVYRLTGSTLATGLALMAQLVPRVLLGTVAGVIADRWDRKRILVISAPLQAVVLMPLLAVRSSEQVWLVYAVASLSAILGVCVGPAENSLLPDLVEKDHLVAANSLNALNDNLARLLGPALGGLAVARWGLSGVALLDAASFLIAGAMIAAIRVPGSRPGGGRAPGGAPLTSPAVARRGRSTAVWREWLEGLAQVRRSRPVAGVFAVIAVAAFADAIMTPLWVVFLFDVLGGTAVQLGWLSTANGIGGLAGSVLLAHLGRRVPLRHLIAGSAALIGLLDLLVFNLPSLPLTLVALVAGGAAVVGLYTGLRTLLQTKVDDRYRGRVFGAYGTTSSLLTLAGMGLGGALGDLLPLPLLMNTSAALYLLSGTVARLTLHGDADAATHDAPPASPPPHGPLTLREGAPCEAGKLGHCPRECG